MTSMRATRWITAPAVGQFSIYVPDHPEIAPWTFTFKHSAPAQALNYFLDVHKGLDVLDCAIVYGTG